MQEFLRAEIFDSDNPQNNKAVERIVTEKRVEVPVYIESKTLKLAAIVVLSLFLMLFLMLSGSIAFFLLGS